MTDRRGRGSRMGVPESGKSRRALSSSGGPTLDPANARTPVRPSPPLEAPTTGSDEGDPGLASLFRRKFLADMPSFRPRGVAGGVAGLIRALTRPWGEVPFPLQMGTFSFWGSAVRAGLVRAVAACRQYPSERGGLPSVHPALSARARGRSARWPRPCGRGLCATATGDGRGPGGLGETGLRGRGHRLSTRPRRRPWPGPWP